MPEILDFKLEFDVFEVILAGLLYLGKYFIEVVDFFEPRRLEFLQQKHNLFVRNKSGLGQLLINFILCVALFEPKTLYLTLNFV